MACPLLLVNDETAWGRADDAAAGGNVREEAVVVAGENVLAQPSESARGPAADGRVLVLADGGVPAYAV